MVSARRGGRFVDLLLTGTGSRDGEAIAGGTAPRAVRALASLCNLTRRATQ
ncbi:hypothetical protein [Vannielia litorea]|uniref:hypothetical protein n=1 Tax=Vannielia litorea TaxID=1217970 RepID=UPI00158809B8|nr:hypothetical protein [Vannielia litorea]